MLFQISDFINTRLYIPSLTYHTDPGLHLLVHYRQTGNNGSTGKTSLEISQTMLEKVQVNTKINTLFTLPSNSACANLNQPNYSIVISQHQLNHYYHVISKCFAIFHVPESGLNIWSDLSDLSDQ